MARPHSIEAVGIEAFINNRYEYITRYAGNGHPPFELFETMLRANKSYPHIAKVFSTDTRKIAGETVRHWHQQYKREGRQ